MYPSNKPLSSPPDFAPSGTQDGWTSLMGASRNGDLEVVKSLVASGADVNAKDNVGDGMYGV